MSPNSLLTSRGFIFGFGFAISLIITVLVEVTVFTSLGLFRPDFIIPYFENISAILWRISPDYVKSSFVNIFVTRIIYRSDIPNSQIGARPTIDVFWCYGDGKASNRLVAATELAAAYATVTRLVVSQTVEIGEIRTRPIEKDAFLTNLDPKDAKVVGDRALIRFDPKDTGLKDIVDKVIAKGQLPSEVSAATSSAYVPNYVSVYVCTDLDASALAGRLFFQVKEAKQEDAAKRAVAAISKQFPGLSVARDIQIVGDKAPPTSELRYFFEDDASVAARAAREISQATAATIVAKRVEGFEDKISRGTMEAWISQ